MMLQPSTETATTLSFQRFASEDHRRFHDRIVAELNGILPVCNQGKCTAADISDSSTEQQQITDLMQKVEQLCSQLSENVTDLFSHYYQERGRFCGAAYCTTAEMKVNLVDRTLQDRSTDVRWWSKEPVLASAVTTLRKIGKSLGNDLQEMEAYLEGAIATFRIPKPGSDWTSIDIADRVQEVTTYFDRVGELMFNGTVRQDFITAMQGLIELLAKGDGQENAVKFAQRLIKKLRTCEQRVADACHQLEVIRKAYPSIYDIIVTDSNGVVIATARPSERTEILSTSLQDHPWCRNALRASVNSTHIERVTIGEEKCPAIVFASSIRDPEDRQASPIGAIGVFCDFQDEVHDLLSNYLPVDEEGRTRDGWFSFFTDKRGVVICANDPDAVPPGHHCQLPRSHRQLQKGEKRWSSLVFNGRESFVFSACSLDYRTQAESGWISHVIAPASDLMQQGSREPRLALRESQLLQSKLVPEISKSTYASLKEDRKAIKLISLNGILFASQLGKRGAALAPVFDKITATGDSATSRMEGLLYEMAGSEIDLNLRLQEMLAKQAVDLIAQKVYERSQALRLWARTAQIQEFLRSPDEETTPSVEQLLKLINDDYPSYRNILLVDINGDIRACSRPRKLSEQDGLCVADQGWYLAATRADSEAPPQITETRGESIDPDNATSIVFAQGVTDPEQSHSLVGALACLFDWKAEAAEVVGSCLPKGASGRVVSGSFALFTNQDQKILESTSHSLLVPGESFSLPDEHLQLAPGQATSSQFQFRGEAYILASAKCQMPGGYRVIDWTSHVLRPLG